MPGDGAVCYWDSCVLLAFINDEEDRSDAVETMLEEAGGGRYEILTSAFTPAEVAFSEEEKEHGLDDDVAAAIDQLWTVESPVTVVEFYPQIAHTARDLIREGRRHGLSLKPPDAIHLATAMRVDADEFHTYDEKLVAYSDLAGLKIVEPEPEQPRLV